MNRITFPPLRHPFDEPLAARRLGVLRTLCQAIMVGLLGITFGVWMVVQYALGGQPLAGNRIQLGGVSLVTVIAAVITLVVIPVALWAGHRRSQMAPRDGQSPLDGFAAATFATYAVALAWGFLCAAVFHLTSDPLLAALVGVMVVTMLARYPTTTRAKAWYARYVAANRG